MSFTGELWGRTPPLEDDSTPKSPEGGTTDLVIRQARIIHELRTELVALKKFTACTRSHPHEAMTQDCELRTEIAPLTLYQFQRPIMTTAIKQAEEQQKKLNQMIAAPKASIPSTYGIPEALIELKSGEHYAGTALGAEGQPSHHLILLPGDGDMTWSKASEWAASIGGELPTSQEQALLFANLKGKFEPAYYWSNEQHASYADYAWAQDFYDGYQDRYGKDSELRARAIRRVPIHKEAA